MTRMQRRRILWANKRRILINIFAAFLLIVTLYQHYVEDSVPVSASAYGNQFVSTHTEWYEVLSYGIPGLETVNKDGAKSGKGMGQSVFNMIRLVTSIDGQDIRSLIRAEIPVLATVKTVAGTASNTTAMPKFDKIKTIPEGKPIVALYHTHTAESFIPSSGVAHAPGGQTGEIVEVGDALVQALAQKNIVALHDKTIHDYPSFMKAYGKSEETVTRIVKENPSVEMIFDVHRDADKRANVITTIQGQNVAQITIIVAQGQADLPQPHWEENYAFAKLIKNKCDAKYPDLIKSIQLVDWRYNQHLHPHALLLEVGSQETSLEEGEQAMLLLGDILSEIIQENK